MRKEAEAHAEEDRQRRELVEVRNQADQLVNVVEKTLKEAGDKVDATTKSAIEVKVEELKKLKDGNDVESLKRKLDEISQEIQKVGAAMYKDHPPAGEAGKPDEKKDDKPKDAEFEEKK